MTDEQDRPVPRLYDWAVGVFDKMFAQAKPEEVDGETCMVYEGHLTNLFRDLDVPNPYYTKITKALKAQECVLQLRRGGGSAMSRWIMIKKPESDSFREMTERGQAPRGKVAMLEQRVGDLTKLVRTQNERLEWLVERVDQMEAAK